jgi:hypothetical protein
LSEAWLWLADIAVGQFAWTNVIRASAIWITVPRQPKAAAGEKG